MTKYYYMEDFNGGFICYEKDKDFYLTLESNPVICAYGSKEDIEGYLGCPFVERVVSIPPYIR